MTRHKEPAVIVGMAVAQMGSMQALANALQVRLSTVYRWRNGESGLQGTGLVAIMALIRHPEDFQRYRED